MKVFAENHEFHTIRRMYTRGREIESTGSIKLEIHVIGIVTEGMAAELEKLATEMQEKAKKIVAAQETPQQIFKTDEDVATEVWLHSFEEHHKADDDNPSEC